MQSMGGLLSRERGRLNLPASDASDPEFIAARFLERPLFATARVEAELTTARAADDERMIRHWQAELERCQERDRLQAGRPDGCWCLGIGGYGRVASPGLQGGDDALLSWRVWCVCPDGQRMKREVDAARVELRRAHQQAIIDRLFGSLPQRYTSWTLDTLGDLSEDHTRLAARLRRWLDERDRWLFLYGEVGRGKTGAAVGALKVLAERGHTALYVDAAVLLDRLRSSYDSNEAFTQSVDTAWNALLGVNVLLIDDLGSERHRPGEAVDWATERLWLLVGDRYREERRTLVTSNHSLPELTELFGHPRITSRIGEAAVVLDCNGLPNLRRPVAGAL